MEAVRIDLLDVVKKLVEGKLIPPTERYVCLLLRSGLKIGIVKQDIPCRTRATLLTKTSGEWAPLELAAYSGRLEIVQHFVHLGADCSFQNEESWKTAIMLAAEWGHLEVIKFLAQSGADFKNVKDLEGRSTLHLAVTYITLANVEVVKWLFENGADHNAVNNKERTVVEHLMYMKALWEHNTRKKTKRQRGS